MKIRLDNVNISYGDREIYKDFSLEITPNKITGILGRSGCGKTTLLNYMISKVMENEDISYVFQNDILIEWMTVYDNINLILKSKIKSKSERNKIIETALDKVNLRGCKDFYPNKLSGGMRQRVNIARAVSYPSKYLFMDEPFKSLDIVNKFEIIKSLKKEISKQDKTVIIVTHDLDEILEFSDEIICLSGSPIKKINYFTVNKCISKNELIKYI